MITQRKLSVVIVWQLGRLAQGFCMNIGELRGALSKIEAFSGTPNRHQDAALAKKINNKFLDRKAGSVLRPEDYTILIEGFQERWKAVFDTEFDYTRLQTGVNQLWIALAHQLANHLKQAQLKSSAYRLLMPSVQNTHNRVYMEPMEHFPLNELIVSDDRKQLVVIREIFDNFRSRGALVYHNRSLQGDKISDTELQRIQKVNPKYWQQYQQQVIPFQDDTARVTARTTGVIKAFIEKTFFYSGIGAFYDQSQETSATKAYDELRSYLKSLSQPEHDALFDSMVCRGNKARLIKDIFHCAFVEPTDCITTTCLWLGKFVTDYEPDASFENEGLNISALEEEWKKHSKKKEYSTRIPIQGYEDEDRCHRQVLQIKFFLQVHTFSVFSLLSYGGHTTKTPLGDNSITETGKLLLDVLNQAPDTLSYAKALYIAIENTIKPRAQGKPWARYNETQLWLQSVLSGDFSKQNRFDLSRNENVFVAQVLELIDIALGERQSLGFLEDAIFPKGLAKHFTRLARDVMHIFIQNREAPRGCIGDQLILMLKEFQQQRLVSHLSHESVRVFDDYLSYLIAAAQGLSPEPIEGKLNSIETPLQASEFINQHFRRSIEKDIVERLASPSKVRFFSREPAVVASPDSSVSWYTNELKSITPESFQRNWLGRERLMKASPYLTKLYCASAENDEGYRRHV